MPRNIWVAAAIKPNAKKIITYTRNCLITRLTSSDMVLESNGGGFRLPLAVAFRDSKEYFNTINQNIPRMIAIIKPGPDKNNETTATTVIRIKGEGENG
jgi:hypothetical protein